jgi:hypothetical protein
MWNRLSFLYGRTDYRLYLPLWWQKCFLPKPPVLGTLFASISALIAEGTVLMNVRPVEALFMSSPSLNLFPTLGRTELPEKMAGGGYCPFFGDGYSETNGRQLFKAMQLKPKQSQ